MIGVKSRYSKTRGAVAYAPGNGFDGLVPGRS